MNNFFGNKQLILVLLFLFSVASSQSTTGITTATTMVAAGRYASLAPHKRPGAPCQHVEWMGNNPLSLQMYFGGGLRVFMALKALLCSGDDALPQKLECFEGHAHPNSPKSYICLLGGVSPIQSTCQNGAKGLMWGTRGPFLPAVAMAGYGCDGRCWPLEAYIRWTYCRNCKKFLRKYFFYSYVVPIHSWHLTCQLNKEDLDLCTWAFRCFLCPIFYGNTGSVFWFAYFWRNESPSLFLFL